MVICGSSRRSLENPGSPEAVALAGLEVHGADVIQDKAGRAEPGARGTCRGQTPPPLLLRADGQAPLQGAVRDGGYPGLVEDPQAVELADGLDDPRQHQLPEGSVPADRLLQPQHPVCPLQGIHQVAHLRGGDRQRPAARGLQAQAELLLPGRDPLLRRRLQRLQLRLVVSRPQVLDLASPRREDHTIRTAVAPDVVLTVRMYGTTPLYGPRLVRKSSLRKPETRRSTTRDTRYGEIADQLRYDDPGQRPVRGM